MKAWTQFLKFLEEILGKKAVDQWLRPLRIVKFDARNLYLDAQNAFQLDWFYEHIPQKYRSSLKAPSGHPITLHFSLKGAPFNREKKKKQPVKEENLPPFSQSHLEPQANLTSFLTKDERSLPLEVIKEWVSRPLPLRVEGENPLYFYGPLGSGKTHLLMAAAKALSEQGLRPFFIRAETFAEHVVRAFRSRRLQEFRRTYRAIDALLIDDVHLFARKTATQEEFFHTFNWLHATGRPIIVTANNPPQRLEEVAERLISRFEWGLTFPLTSPSQALKRAIIDQRKCGLGLILDEKLTTFLLETFENSHVLVRALEALALRSDNHNGPIDLEIARSLLSDLVAEETANRLSEHKVIESVARYFGIKVEEILSRSQSKECTLPRQIAMYFCRKKLHLPYMKIGRTFSRDHSTVISSIKLVMQGAEKKNQAISLPLQVIESRLMNLSLKSAKGIKFS